MTRVNRSLLLAVVVGCLVVLVSCKTAPDAPATTGGSTPTAMAAPPPPAPPAPAVVSTPPTPPQPPPAPADNAARITVADAKKALDEGRAVIVDVRTYQQWSIEHIKGTIHIPEAELQTRLKELPKDKMIITYCS